MILEIDMAGDIPIYQQIRNQIVFGAATGRLKVGEPLPTVRQLASDIGVNPMTVNKAYGLLKDEGVIVIDRRHGAKINELPSADDGFINDNLTAEFEQRAALLISEARMKGVSQENLRVHLNILVDNIYNQKGEIL